MPVQRAINDLIETRVSWIVKPLMESDLYPNVPLLVNFRSSSAASCLSLGVLFYLQQAQTRTVSTERRGRFRKVWVGSSFCPQAGGYLWCPPRMTTDRVPSGRDRKSRRRRRSSFSIVMSMSRSCGKKSPIMVCEERWERKETLIFLSAFHILELHDAKLTWDPMGVWLSSPSAALSWESTVLALGIVMATQEVKCVGVRVELTR